MEVQFEHDGNFDLFSGVHFGPAGFEKRKFTSDEKKKFTLDTIKKEVHFEHLRRFAKTPEHIIYIAHLSSPEHTRRSILKNNAKTLKEIRKNMGFVY